MAEQRTVAKTAVANFIQNSLNIPAAEVMYILIERKGIILRRLPVFGGAEDETILYRYT